MQCPRCRSSQFQPAAPCPDCEFTGDVHTLERLSNLQFLLAEIETWSRLPSSLLVWLREKYGGQLRHVEVSLGLRLPPPDAAETALLRAQLAQLRALQTALLNWHTNGWLSFDDQQRLSLETAASIKTLQDQLIDAPSTPFPSLQKQLLQRIEHQQFLLETVEQLFADGVISEMGYETAVTHITNAITELEIRAGLYRPPEPKSPPEAPEPEEIIVEPAQPAQPKREPWTWDRVWDSLLSERTLQAILFLGALLLFASGVSWVAWNWGTFPPVMQVAFLSGFTSLFFGISWYVTHRMQLRGSGIALSGVGSLLLPLDFYAFYLSGGFPPESWPTVWLMGSLVCLVAYLLVAYLLRAEFFGYLVAAALGSSVVALLNWLHAEVFWWQTAVSAVALLLIILGVQLPKRVHNRRWHSLASPFCHMALAFALPVMALGIGWSLFVGGMGRPFLLALFLSWWLGSITLTLATRRFRLRGLVWAAVLAYPVAVWLTERWFFLPAGIYLAWYALGIALLVPAYFVIGWKLTEGNLTQRRGDTEGKENLWLTPFEDDAVYGRIVLAAGGVLTAVAAAWSLGDPSAAGVVHPLLAASMILAARLWQQPRRLWLTGLFLLSGTAAWQGGRGAEPAELTLPWGMLSVLLIGAAIRLKQVRVRYDTPLYGSGLAAAGLAVLPALVLYDQPLLIYALLNWIGINGWLAVLAQEKQTAPGLQSLPAGRWLQRWGGTIFHWFAALPLIPWLWLAWTNSNADRSPLALAYAVMAWGMLWLCVRVRRVVWQNGRPWQLAAHLSNVTAVGLVLFGSQEPWRAGVFVGTAVFYFVASRMLHHRNWLYVGSWLFPVGWLMTLNWLRSPDWLFPPALSLVVLAYLLVAFWQAFRGGNRAFLQPLVHTAVLLGGLQAIFYTVIILDSADAMVLGAAAAYLILGVSFLLYAWMQQESLWGHVGIWLVTIAGGLAVKVYSHGSGRSAALGALLAAGYVLGERGLRYLAVTQRGPFAGGLRQAWRLFRHPLLVAGWTVSIGTIGWAVVRNLFLLGGGRTRETWSVVALLLLIGLYAASAKLFHKARFVAFASLLAFLPWTILTHLGWYVAPTPSWTGYGLSWSILALVLLGVGVLLSFRLGRNRWSLPPQVVGHGLLPLALLWAVLDVDVSSLSVGVAILFYGMAVWLDRRFRDKAPTPSARFLHPAAFLTPLWAVYGMLRWFPSSSETDVGLLLPAFSLPALWLGRRWARWEPGYRWPLYWLAYGTAVFSMLLVIEDQPVLIGVLLFNVGLAVLSVRVFRRAEWWVPATILLPVAGALFLTEVGLDELRFTGWMMIGLGSIYLLGAWLLSQRGLARYAGPLLVMAFLLTGAGLLPASETAVGVLVGYGLATAVYATIALWKRWPVVLHLAVYLAVIAYGAVLSLLNVSIEYLGLALWPGILAVFALAVYFDMRRGAEPDRLGNKLQPFPRQQPAMWMAAAWGRLLRWWALPLYLVAFAGAAVSGMIAIFGEWQWFVALGLGTAVYTWALFRFRLRGWLLPAAGWGQLTALALIRWIGWTDSPAQMALAFMPVTLITAAMGLLVEQLRQEGPPFAEKGWQLGGWSRPFYLLLLFNLGFGQLFALFGEGAGTAVTLFHILILGTLATVWRLAAMTYVPLFLGLLALLHFLSWRDTATTDFPPAMALLSLVYGTVGYGYRVWQRLKRRGLLWLGVWERPLRISGGLLSGLALFMAFSVGVDVPALVFRALVGLFTLTPMEFQQVNMMMLTLAILGLEYLLAALVEQRPRLGYGALALLLGSWSLWLLLIARQDELQLYALPAGIYLLGIGRLEWQTGKRQLALWIDRAALLLLFGSVFWQSFGPHGGWYALLMIGEGLLVAWLGSWRRLRRLLYAGVTAVVIAVGGQLIEPLLALNTFVLLLLGVLLVALGIGLERRLEKVRAVSKEWRNRLEHWE